MQTVQVRRRKRLEAFRRITPKWITNTNTESVSVEKQQQVVIRSINQIRNDVFKFDLIGLMVCVNVCSFWD